MERESVEMNVDVEYKFILGIEYVIIDRVNVRTQSFDPIHDITEAITLSRRRANIREGFGQLGIYFGIDGKARTHEMHIYGIETIISVPEMYSFYIQCVEGFIICILRHAILCMFADIALIKGDLVEATKYNLEANNLRYIIERAAVSNKANIRNNGERNDKVELVDIYKALELPTPIEFVTTTSRPDKVEIFIRKVKGTLI